MENGQVDWSIIGCGDGLSERLPTESVFWVRSPSTLIQLSGYAKFLCRESGPVYFRGQGKYYNSMIPTLYRGCPSVTSFTNRRVSISNKIKELKHVKAFMKSTPEYAYEPLMQHYGFNTKWLDLVDNIWTALWFASHKSHVTGKNKNYLHFEISNEEFCYIFFFSAGKVVQGKNLVSYLQTQNST